MLRELEIKRVHQVWATDITYISMATGFFYLMVIIDLKSRHILYWSISNTMKAEWCQQVM
ncbi:MAG: DDE-type integrase/transposase/recombinase [Cytophagales bacterium]|nr:DDE-type integrase/transposase/recombinase [Cytophagales bacterium]